MKANFLLALCALAQFCASSAYANTIRTVAVSGSVAPGTVANFVSFPKPQINNAGQIAFSASTKDLSLEVIYSSGVWFEAAGTLAIVSPPTSGEHFFGLGVSSYAALNDAGEMVFVASSGISHQFPSDTGVWSNQGGSFELVAGLEASAPGTSANFDVFANTTPAINNSGQTAFSAYLSGAGVDSSNDFGLWSEGSGSLELVARKGNPAPETSASFLWIADYDPLLNDLGQTAFAASLTGSGVDSSNDAGIWSGGSGNLRLVMREGNLAPGTGYNFQLDRRVKLAPTLNNLGQVAFSARVSSPQFSDGIWSEGSGSLELVAFEGDVAPGTTNNFGNLLNSTPAFNDAGQTAFLGEAGSDQGIWSEGGGSLALVALEGQMAPGTNWVFETFDKPVINNTGQVAFLANEHQANVGIWAQNLAGELKLIAKNGDVIDVDEGPGTDLRSISSLVLEFGSINDGNRRGGGFSDLGQIAFQAIFTDGSKAILVSDRVAIPEPTNLFLAAMGGIFCLVGIRFRGV